jgi:molybdopterin-containing oxidoreductase family membrane subunit
VDRFTELKISSRVIDLLRIIVTVSMQIHLFMIGVEIITDFYNQAEHSASLVYLLFGLRGFTGMVPWFWSSLALSIVGVSILSIYPFYKRVWLLNLACGLTIVGVWIEKGMGLVISGFIPTPVGEIVEYLPTVNEILITLGIWSCGMLVFTLLVKAAIPIDRGHVKYSPAKP